MAKSWARRCPFWLNFSRDDLLPFFRSCSLKNKWYECEVPGLGADFTKEFDHALNLLLADPLRWRKIEPDIRRCLMRRFPYSIIYDIRGDCLRIIAIAHQHREPEYWRDRLA